MLSFFRNNIQSFIVKFIVAIVSLVMVGFGVSTFTNQGVNVIADVDGNEIKLENYQRAYEQTEQNIRRSYGKNADQVIKSNNLKSRILQQLINNLLLLESAKVNGLTVTDQELADAIYNTPTFQTDNRFDELKYQDMLKQNRISNLVYEKELRDSLLMRKYFSFLGDGITISKQYLQDEIRRKETDVLIDYIEMKPSLITQPIKISEEEVKTFYEKNSDQFKKATQFVLNYIQLDLDKVLSKVQVKDKEIDRYYDKNKDTEFTKKDSYHSRHILIRAQGDENSNDVKAAKIKIQGIYKQLQENKKQFSKLAKKYSEDPGSKNKGGDLGWAEYGTFVKEFDQVVSGLKPSQISKPFKSNFGYHIVELIQKQPARTIPFKEARTTITEKIKNIKGKRRLGNLVRKIETRIQTESFDQIAQSLEKKVLRTEAFDQQTNLETIGFSYMLYQNLSAKGLNDKGFYELPSGQGTIVYEIAKIIDPSVRPFDEVKEQIKMKLTGDKKNNLLNDLAMKLAEQTKTKNDLFQSAKKHKTKPLKATLKISQATSNELKVGAGFLDDLYKLKKGEVKLLKDNNRRFLVHVSQVRFQEIKPDSGKLVELENQLKRQKTEALLGGILAEMRTLIPIKYNDSMLKTLDIQFTS
ncbi:MAG: SurA N-terminal domain-containing protein [Deltaproteobacteria bacterium]|nr:SurA N-terminal domain-containing protein [Deltaproteobacteria bacterium]